MEELIVIRTSHIAILRRVVDFCLTGSSGCR